MVNVKPIKDKNIYLIFHFTSQAANNLVITLGSLMSLPPLRITWVCTLASLEKTKVYLLVSLPQQS